MAELRIGSKKELEDSAKKRKEALEIERRRKFTRGIGTSEIDYKNFPSKGDPKEQKKIVEDIMPFTKETQSLQPDPNIQPKKVSPTKSTAENIQGSVEDAFEEVEKANKELSIDTVEPVEPGDQKDPEKGGLSDGLRDALMYLGPRLGGLLIGGYEGYQEADKLATGFQKFQAGKEKEKGFQQTSYQTLDGKPVFLKGNQLVDQDGNILTKEQVRHGAAVGAERSEKLKQAKNKQALKRTSLKEFRKSEKDIKDRLLTTDKAISVISSKAKLVLPFAARALVLASGDKRISDADVQQFRGNMSLINKARQTMERWKKGDTSTEADREAFMELFRVLRAADQGALQKSAREISASAGELREDTSSEEIWEILSAKRGWGKYEQEEEVEQYKGPTGTAFKYSEEEQELMDLYK